MSGGVKVADKIGVIERLAGPADAILIGGAMAYTFAVAQGGRVGDSLHEDEEGQESARRALAACREAGCELLLPPDSVCGRSFSADPPQQVFPSDEHRRRLDGARHRAAGGRDATPRAVRDAATVFWNGPMGAFELAPYAAGTTAIAEAVAALRAARRSSAEAIRSRRSTQAGPRGSGHARLHRRGRQPRAARGPHAAGRRGTAHGVRTRWTSARR